MSSINDSTKRFSRSSQSQASEVVKIVRAGRSIFAAKRPEDVREQRHATLSSRVDTLSKGRKEGRKEREEKRENSRRVEELKQAVGSLEQCAGRTGAGCGKGEIICSAPRRMGSRGYMYSWSHHQPNPCTEISWFECGKDAKTQVGGSTVQRLCRRDWLQ